MTGANAQREENDAALVLFKELSEQFHKTPLGTVDPALVRAWRSRTSLWQRMLPLFALQAGLKTEYSQVDGHQLHYWVGGLLSGPVVVLLHGFGSNKENWAFLTGKLAKNYRLLVPDLPGFGQSDFVPSADYHLAAQADRVAAWLKGLGIECAHFVGSSMGGAIAAQVAARHPSLVEKLCLMNAVGAPGKHLTQLESGLAAGVNYLAPTRAKDAWQLFAIVLHPQRRLLGLLFSLLMGGVMSQRKIPNDFLFCKLVDSFADTYRQLPSISAPTLVLWGGSDQVLDASCAEVFCERIAGAKAMVLPAVGHLPMLEVPGITARVLHDFWRAN
ncbi:MAG: alpha/beta fold hydrolase [Zhongshania sp.]|uniref:alpha/beta fold hydrolase n=1 Tax=Zhongshania sp. TaxID=1971902 RepID=UPI00260661AC|nr:alpha/beta fold hydrolase [Zhongshania sp.]MDF1690967.1 alpha/beta fold hydrolase [Zhongshania sp.]